MACIAICIVLMVSWLPVFPSAGADRVDVVEGRVVDARTGDALPGATVQIRDTYRGTVTNSDGRFALYVDSFPVVLDIRFIGYRSGTIELSAVPGDPLHVRLEPSSILMPEMTISSEDPAVGIMRRVIARKQDSRRDLQTYSVDAYNRFRVENDTGIVSIWESFTRAFWDRDRGMREVSIWQENTDNMDVSGLIPAAVLIVNLYDDNVDVMGHTLMGVTHPRALDMYRFRLDSLRSRDESIVYDIEVEPGSRTGSGFRGRLSVLDGEWAILSAELEPGSSFLFPPPIDRVEVSYHQQFASFGDRVWFPVGLTSHMDVDISLGVLFSFPTFRIRQLSRLSDFQLNVAIPDSLYDSDDLVVVDSLLRQESRPADLVSVPLTPLEARAYDNIDSTMTMEKAFSPGGLAGRFVRLNNTRESGERQLPGTLNRFSIRPELWVNRVEGGHAGLSVKARLRDDVHIAGRIGYGETIREWSHGASFERDGIWGGRLEWSDDIHIRTESRLSGQFLNSAGVLMGLTDYFDYVRREGMTAWLSRGGPQRNDWRLSLGYSRYRYAPVAQQLESTFLGLRTEIRQNLPVPSGSLRTVRLRLEKTWEYAPFAIGPQRRLVLDIERGTGGSLQGASPHTRVDGEWLWRIPTFNKRRFLSQVLDVRLAGGFTAGSAPLVRMGVVDGSGRFSGFGGLRTRQNRPYEGTRYGLLTWEHSFRTVPFERMGWDGLVRRHWNLILFGGHGQAWLPAGHVAANRASRGMHHEMGVSLSGLFSIVRIDAAWRLDKAAFIPGVSVARVF